MEYLITDIRRLCGSVATVVFVMSLGASASAQGGAPPGAGPPAANNPRIEGRARDASESRLRSAEMDAAVESENQKRVQAAIVHMKEDFTRIQVLRNDIARNLVAHKPLDYNLISEQTGEINKRASELNVYMLARVSEEKELNNSANAPNEEMMGALVKLCKLVDSFTENPALKNAATVDAKDAEKAKENKARADKDLLSIIQLSESIKKKSDSLKAPEKP